jgi:molybdenum cofactor cytidylyltransferase
MKREQNHLIAMIFLCAGASLRMGRSKALLPWADATVLAHHWNLFLTLDHYEPWIVTQKEDNPLFNELDRLGWPKQKQIINSKAPECDMMASIRCGIAACAERDYDSIGVALIDQPLIKQATFQSLERAVYKSPEDIIQPSFKRRRGHPVILPRTVAKELMNSNAETLKSFLSEYDHLRTSVEVDDAGITIDLDTPDAYKTHLPLTA